MEPTLEDAVLGDQSAPTLVVEEPPLTQVQTRVPARLVEYDWGRFVALPVHTTYEVIEQPEPVEVPGAPYFALGMLRWQNGWLPVLDLCTLIHAHHKPGAPHMRHALIVAYQTAPREPLRYAALAMVSLPQTVQVGDDQVCPLPDDSDLWPLIADSCFSHADGAVPIVHTGRLLAQAVC